ncbi:hypothetical protein GH714_032335 [Hevea brasiliensis]|uniref:Uncharacterized protein n=1 Tax=Hevea brasiliensis TaxID=3981 RepID=A0A6A6L479_HEVBR|nr:hypothetical protein GH714_032335 [Hevea brasiliensis]
MEDERVYREVSNGQVREESASGRKSKGKGNQSQQVISVNGVPESHATSVSQEIGDDVPYSTIPPKVQSLDTDVP